MEQNLSLFVEIAERPFNNQNPLRARSNKEVKGNDKGQRTKDKRQKTKDRRHIWKEVVTVVSNLRSSCL